MYFSFRTGIMDQIDEKILKNLLVDGRLSARKLSLTLGMSTVTILSRIKKLEKKGIIIGYSVRLNHDELGYSLSAVIEIVAKKNQLVRIESQLSGMANVCAVYDVTGSTDTIVIAKFRNRKELSKFVKSLASIEGVESTITHIVLNTSKEDFRLS